MVGFSERGERFGIGICCGSTGNGLRDRRVDRAKTTTGNKEERAGEAVQLL
jgi:hypothetical protein